MSEVDEAPKLWKVHRTLHEMVKDRVSTIPYFLIMRLSDAASPMFQGYQVSDEEINIDLATFRSIYANSAGMVE